jgi:uncharacterized protein YybS (DUF2232 family)
MRLTDGGFWLDVVKGTVLTLALFLAYVTFPLFGMLPGFFAPLPCLFFTCKRGALAGTAIVVACAAALSALGDPAVPLLYLLQSGVLALVLGAVYRQGKGVARSLTYAVSVDFVLILGLAIGYGLFQGVDLYAIVLKGIDASIVQTAKFYEQQGIKGDELQFFKQGMQQGGAFIARTFPALLLVSLGTIAGLNLQLLFRFSGKLPGLPLPGLFRTFKNPEPLVWVLILAGFAMLVPSRPVETVALNVLIVIGSMYLLQGLAVVQHFFNRFAVPRFMRVIIYLFLTLQPYLLLAVACVGVFDIWGNFRAPRTTENL